MYKRSGGNASPTFVMFHYQELAASAQVVLMRGEVLEPKILSAAEAAILTSLIQIYYLNDANYNSMVKVFNETPAKFDFMSLLKGIKDV
jgi:ATP synthase F1 complex assembly factor 1